MGNKRFEIRYDKDNTSSKRAIAALERVMQDHIVAENTDFILDFGRLIERLQDDTFRLAVVGEFSSGKSTFLNALIGKDLLKHGAQETTATITEIYNDSNQKDETLLDVYYFDKSVKYGVSPENISEVTATSSQTYSVAKEIEKVVIRSRIFDNGINACFCDTPGLNGNADLHREKTIDQVKNAHACIYLLSVRGLSHSDIEFLKYVCRYQHNIIFVQNFIDELKSLEGETPEEKVAEQKHIIESQLLEDFPDLKFDIVAISARKALIAREKSFSIYNELPLTDSVRNRLYEESRFDSVFDAINVIMSRNEKEQIKLKDTVAVALSILEQLRDVITYQNEKEKAVLENSVEGVNKRNYTKLLETLESSQEPNEKKLQNFVISEASIIRRQTVKEISAGIEEIETYLKGIISGHSSIEIFEKYVTDELSGGLNYRVSCLEDALNKKLNIRFENVISNAVLRIQQYTGVAATADNGDFHAEIQKADIDHFEMEESEINRLQRQLKEKELEYEQEQSVKSAYQSKKTDLEAELRDIRCQKSATLQKKTLEVQQIGLMPEKEKKTRTVTKFEYRGGLGILDSLFGPKEVQKIETYYDDTRQKEWINKKSKIEQDYRNKVDGYSALERRLSTQLVQCDEDIKHVESMDEAKKKEIITMRQRLASKRELLETEREKAKMEYLKESKKQLLAEIHEYLENIDGQMQDGFTKAIGVNEKKVSEIILSMFRTALSVRKNNLRKVIEGFKVGEPTTLESSKLLEKIDNSINELEVLVC